MKVAVNMKKLGKRKNSIEKVPYEIDKPPTTVRELIEGMVLACVADYNQRIESQEILKNLSLEEIEDQAVGGKIGFGVNYGEKQANAGKAVENALQCFEDGIYRIFYGERQLEGLDEPLDLVEGCEFTFVRLTMLAGRMW